ncbi:MAG: DUF4238 domain-containing protein [Chlorobi bacterium]|nr:DUF4238 domain-containing protein [Chlorobiota bacterium]
MSHKKQHIVSETYLKYFSKGNSGKGIYVLHLNDNFKKDIRTYNSGDKVFWSKNFYNTSEFKNPKTIEIFLGQKIENSYNSLIEKISNLNSIADNEFKVFIFQWVFYSKLRSPIWRTYLQFLLNEKGLNFDLNSKELREEHMQFFSDSNILEAFIEYYNDSLIAKKWRILISPEKYNWITSDNPGFAVATKEFAENPTEYFPNPLWTGIEHYTALYFPLTKKYCLEICPYNQNDDVKRNFGNDYIEYDKSPIGTAKLINNWTVLTADKIIISSSEYELHEYEDKIKKAPNNV